MKQGFPIATKGLVIGLLGGSFDPAHQGHVHISKAALARMGIDRVWWLVSPGNPLKPNPPAPMIQRLTHARKIMRDPRVTVTDLEVRLGTRMTADTLRRLMAIYPGVTFVWLMGADNLVQFHKWNRWHDIMGRVSIGVLARPGSGIAARRSVAAQVYSGRRVGRGENLSHKRAPAWVFVNVPLNRMSSSDIRSRGKWIPAP